MYRLIPAFIQEQFVNEQTSGSFQAAALFVDISGFTAITDALMGQGQHGAEVLATILQDIFDPLTESIFAQGGFVTNLAGDAFTAVFPAETLSPVVVQRALAAAWQIQQVMTDLAQYPTPTGTFALSVKVGLAAGKVTWGILTSADERRAAYYFQGPAIDGCALAEKMAGAGQVIAGPTFYSAIESMVAAEPVEDHYRITAINGPLPSAQPINLPAVDPDVMRRFFPPEACRPALGGEFRQVVGMFVSLPTVRTSEQLELFMQTFFELQDRYDGLLNRLDFGDKGASLLLFWGAPMAHENDVIRALNFILDLQSQTVVPVNAGITYQIAHVGYSGGALAGEYTCHGRGLSLAARMMQASPRGEIWVDEDVAERAKPFFEIDFEETVAFKGFSEAKKVFVVLERKQEVELVYGGQMVGRQAEKDRISEFVAPIWDGHSPGIMMIWGEPGIGKSRLVYDFLRHLEESAGQNFAVFVCQADEILRESFNPFRYWLRNYFGQSEQQSETRNKRHFNRVLDQLIASSGQETLTTELDRTRSFLGALINLEWPDSLYSQLDAQGRYENSFASLLTLLKVECSQRPVILLLEDAHWLDADSNAFVHHVAQELAQDRGYPIAILATARLGEDRMAFLDGLSFQEIDLDQLSPDDLAALAEDQLGAPLRPDLLRLLVDRVQGNPFFAEQILRYLQEQDQLVLEEGEWGIKEGQADVLPDDVRAVLIARLDRLTQDVREVVQTASVLGREFEIRVLAHLLHDDPAIREKVAQAEQASIWSALNELRYIFKHTLLRDAAYRMQVRSRRQALHKLAAEALETLYGDDLSSHYGELAYHAERAGLNEAARLYLEQAGDSSKDAYQNSQAIDYYSRALNLTPDEDLESRYRLLLVRAGLYGQLGARDEQWQDLNDLSALAEQLEDVHKRVESLLGRAWFYYWISNYSEALAIARQATVLAQEAEEHQLAADGYYCSTWVLVDQGDFDGA
ncbi:MAG: AAA family ATPase, partial [Candidatus Promineifilaceae bacterium]